MIPAITVWAVDDMCPACGPTLTLADGTGSTRLACPACGWTATWDGEADG
jgi:ribosomal protein S27AE